MSSLLWCVPFAGLLLSIALGLLVLPSTIHHHYGKIVLFWTGLMLVPQVLLIGSGETASLLFHVFLEEYLPFIVLISSLYVIASGIMIAGSSHGTPFHNTKYLSMGTAVASLTGTTGASILFIKPLLRANKYRKYRVHLVIFFIFLVSNIGGSLSPLGDPPLFLGFLKGVDFFWPTVHLFLPMVFISSILLGIFYLLDTYFWRKEDPAIRSHQGGSKEKGLKGLYNIGFLGLLIGSILLSTTWSYELPILSSYHVDLSSLLRDASLITLAVISFLVTPQSIREQNEFDWEPILEVGKIFAGIFITIAPVIGFLEMGQSGPFRSLFVALTTSTGENNPLVYFWLTGVLSSFLDNAPTYLLFFNAAGGDPETLMGAQKTTLVAISAGAVFMGANSYIGNAPNFMVKSIAKKHGVKMPDFFSYMLWAALFLGPIFALFSWLFIM